MPKKLTHEEALEKILKKCKEKDYILLENFQYVNTTIKNIHLKCHKDNHEWFTTYNGFISNNKNCPKCAGMIQMKKDVIMKDILIKCEKENYTFLEFISEITYPFTTYLKLKCNIHDFIYDISYYDFIFKNRKCVKCTNNYRKSKEEYIKVITEKCNKLGYTFLRFLNEYKITNQSILIIDCKINNFIWNTSYQNFINSDTNYPNELKCVKYSPSNKLNNEDVINTIKNKCLEINFTFIEFIEEYKNTNSKFKIKCNSGHEYITTYANFIISNTIKCNKCLGRNNTENEVIDIIKEKCLKMDYTFLNFIEPFKSKDTKFKIKCNKHEYVWETSFKMFIRKDHNCGKCSGRYKTVDEIHDIITEKNIINNYTFLKFINGYKNTRSKMLLKCDNEHEFIISYDKYIYSDRKCSKCIKSNGEIKIEEYLKNNNIDYEMQKRFDDCKNKNSLPFDFYIPKYNICIEYDGIQHFQIVERFGGEKAFKQTQINDNIKNKFCLDNNIPLLRIKYDENIEKKLNEFLMKFA